MRLTLVRHGLPETVQNVTGKAADPGLHPDGVSRAEALARWLADEGADAVVQSPSRRARETAEPLTRALGCFPRTVADLDELDCGNHEYLTLEEMRSTGHPMWTSMACGQHPGGPDAATRFRERAVDAVEKLVKDYAGARIVVVCHGGIINAYIGHVLGISRLLWFEPTYTSVSRVVAARTGERTVVSLNETAHLTGHRFPRR